MAKEKKQFRELSDEELKKVTGGVGLIYNTPRPQIEPMGGNSGNDGNQVQCIASWVVARRENCDYTFIPGGVNGVGTCCLE